MWAPGQADSTTALQNRPASVPSSSPSPEGASLSSSTTTKTRAPRWVSAEPRSDARGSCRRSPDRRSKTGDEAEVPESAESESYNPSSTTERKGTGGTKGIKKNQKKKNEAPPTQEVPSSSSFFYKTYFPRTFIPSSVESIQWNGAREFAKDPGPTRHSTTQDRGIVGVRPKESLFEWRGQRS